MRITVSTRPAWFQIMPAAAVTDLDVIARMHAIAGAELRAHGLDPFTIEASDDRGRRLRLVLDVEAMFRFELRDQIPPGAGVE